MTPPIAAKEVRGSSPQRFDLFVIVDRANEETTFTRQFVDNLLLDFVSKKSIVFLLSHN